MCYIYNGQRNEERKNTSLPSPFLLQKNKGILSVSSNLSSRVWVWRFSYVCNQPEDDDPRLIANRKENILMDYENFKEQFVEDVKERLYEQGTEVDITVKTVNKLNERYEAMTVKPEGSNIGVNIGIDNFYGATQDGISYDDVVDKAVKAISDGFLNQPQIDVASLTDYDQMKDKLVMEVVSAETNKEMLENVPHQNMEDMAVVYRFVLNSDDEGRASILATNQMIENMGVTAFTARQRFFLPMRDSGACPQMPRFCMEYF